MNILKQLAESGTALKRKSTKDFFSPIRIKIILLLAVFVAFVMIGFVAVVKIIERILTTSMIESLRTTLATGVPSPYILESASVEIESILCAALVLTFLFGLLVGLLLLRLTLSPVTEVYTLQKRFISGIAHELRTPLSIMRVNNEVAFLSEQPQTSYAELFEENISDIDKITEMLDTLLLFDHMKSGSTLRFEDVDLRKLIERVITTLSASAKQKDIILSALPVEIPQIHGNATALEQVFFNIIKNAITYTKKGGSVSVGYLGIKNNMIMINIGDTGVGIPQKDLTHIFEPFYRSEKVGKLSGTGIGLAIVFEILKIHKGTIEVESIEGKGTTFTISLPMAKGTEKDPLPVSSSSKISFDFGNNKN